MSTKYVVSSFTGTLNDLDEILEKLEEEVSSYINKFGAELVGGISIIRINFGLVVSQALTYKTGTNDPKTETA